MDREYFEPSQIPNWRFLSSAPELNCSTEQSSDFFFNPSLAGKLNSPPEMGPTSYLGGGDIIPNNSFYSNSPPRIQFPIQKNLPNLGNSISIPVRPKFPAISGDPGLAERAAKFSRFNSRSFNGRTTQFGSNNVESPDRSKTPLIGRTRLPRVSSSPSLKNSTQTQMGVSSVFSDRTELANSNVSSSASEQNPSDENGLKTPIDAKRKRKSISRGNSKVIVSSDSPNATKVEDDLNCKRSKENEKENNGVKTGEETEDEVEKQTKVSPKVTEPPKDYIHVRSRRGQATDSHSLAERVRREKIGERMKFLQDLVPGCNKITGKAVMLDEIINYVQSLQHQVEFLSMKFSTVNSELDFKIDSHLSKEGFQPNRFLPQVGSSASAFYGQESQQVQTDVSKCSMDPLGTKLCRSIDMQLIDEIGQGLPQFGLFSQDDLRSIVQMGYGQNQN